MVRRALIALATLLAIAVAALPLALTLAFDWHETDVLGDQLGTGSDIWIILVVVYAVWLPLCVAGLIYLYDHLGVHYLHSERVPRETKRQRRRRATTAGYLRSQERAQQAAARAGGERPASGSEAPATGAEVPSSRAEGPTSRGGGPASKGRPRGEG